RVQQLCARWASTGDPSQVQPDDPNISPQVSGAFPFGEQTSLSRYYEDLLDLYIFSYCTDIPDLSNAVILKWQETDYLHTWSIPDIQLVIKAFSHLPLTDRLSLYLTDYYAYLWDQTEWRSLKEYVPLRPGIEKFLYAVSRARSPHMASKGDELLDEWCTYHVHVDKNEGKKCLETRDAL
ncbi:hypothetical protein K469DRAFT_491110, partial [Zopfia rhizophila CBS 207.26]